VSALAPIMQGFFTERLAQRRASEHMVAAYRDTFRLLLRYAQQQTGRPPSVLDLADIGPAFIGGFLDHLETSRHNSITTRNARLAAVHALFHYAALRCPEHALLIQRVLAIPQKRADSTDVCFLTRAETAALLSIPDQFTPLGRRDHLLLLVATQTGLRVSELTSLTALTLNSAKAPTCAAPERPQATLHPADPDHRPAAPPLDHRTARRASRSAVPQPNRWAPQPRRRRRPTQQTRDRRRRDLPDPRVQERHTAHPAPYRCHGTAPRRRRHLDHRALARARQHESDRRLPPRRPGPESESPGPDHAPRPEHETLPPDRFAPDLPGKPVVMPGRPPRHQDRGGRPGTTSHPR
jgi:hypothetical protein